MLGITKKSACGNLIETVDARELHAFLESRQEFASWIKKRIEKYGFAEGIDYLTHSPKQGSGNNQGLSSFQPDIRAPD
jgi:phage anti-repressor protein